MNVIGIDVGLTGGVASYDGHTAHAIPMPLIVKDIDVAALLEFIADANHVYIERAQAMPGQGSCSMFNYGRGYGELLGCVKAIKKPFTLVPPKTWQKTCFAGIDSKLKPKQKAAVATSRLLPEFKYTGTKKEILGVNDAVLIAFYGFHLKLSTSK